MPTYVTLCKFTDQGIKVVKDSQETAKEAIQNAEKAGIKVKGHYFLMGEYDVVVISECPNDEAAVASSIVASLGGEIKTTTMRAFTPEEFFEIIDKLP
jgi:uncharacterized protein with GYD domain